MDENFDEDFGYRNIIEDEIYHTEKNIDNENNEQKNVNTHVNNINNSHTAINNNINKIDNENYYDNNNIPYNNDKQMNNIYNFYPNEIIQNDFHKYNNKNLNPNDTCVNFSEVYFNSQSYIVPNDNKKTANTSQTIQYKGKQIITTNEVVTSALCEIFNNGEMNLENKQDMQLLRKKSKRRTKKEVEEEKKLKKNEIKNKKKLGRKQKNQIENGSNKNEHSKSSDDNIVKKIHSFFLDSILNWINKSFIDENKQFQTLTDRKKMKNGILRKISPKVITTNLKKKNVIKTMNTKFKDIFSNKISSKYTKVDENQNKELIEKIYQDKNQPFVIFILELTFIQAFNYFNGQDKGEDCKKNFLFEHFDINLIEQFLKNLDTIKDFLSTIKEKQNNETKEKVKDYAERISLLCLNYSDFFLKKFDRSENKNKKEKEKNEEEMQNK